MRWPLVWASRVDAIVAGWQASVVRETQRGDAWKEAFESERAAHAETRRQMHELRMAGANPATLPKAEPREADPMVLLINARTAGKPAVRSLMLQQLRRDRTAGKSDEDIQRAIESGVQLDGIPA